MSNINNDNNNNNDNIYQQNSYENRDDYLKCLADDYDLPLEIVHNLAEMLEGEEFDGLINALEDAEGMFEE